MQPKYIQVVTNEDTDDSKSTSSKISNKWQNKFKNAASRVAGLNRMYVINKLNNPTKPQAIDDADLEEKDDETYQYDFVERPDDKPPPEPDPIAERMRDERELQNKERIREQERMRKIREEEQLQEEKRKDQLRTLKNKIYTWNYNGEIVLLKTGKAAEQTLQVNEILNIEYKSKEQGVIVKQNTMVPEVKPVREGLGKGDEDRRLEKAIAQEFPKQPPLVEVMQPKTGVQIVFDNGYLKEGGEYLKKDKYSKQQYNDLIENMPRPKPQYKFISEDQVKEVNQVEQKLLDNYHKQQDDREAGESPIINNKKINIQNIDQYMQMIAEKTQRKHSSGSDGSGKLSPKESNFGSQIRLSKLKTSQGPRVQQKIRLERINAYRKDQLIDQDSPRSQLELEKKSKLHRAVDKFDHQQIIENPQWGQVGVMKETKLNATSYKQKRFNHLGQGMKSTPNLKAQSKAAIVFPPIQQNKPKEINKLLPKRVN